MASDKAMPSTARMMILPKAPGLRPDRFGSLHANQTHADGRAETGQTDVDASPQFSQHRRYHNTAFLYFVCSTAPAIEHGQAGEICGTQCAAFSGSSSCEQMSAVNTAVNSMNTSAWTIPTSSSRK